MPGNRAIFNDAIKKGHNAAWDGQWKQAAAEYRRALAEFPTDLNVRGNLAQALEELGQLESALKECQAIAKAQPRDPLVWVRVARVQEKLRRNSEASATYLAIADLYVQAKQGPKAIEAWQKAAQLEPDRTDVHQRLAEVYLQSGQSAQAAEEYLALAQIYRKRGDHAKAQNLAEQALGVDARNPAARAFVEEMGRAKTLPTGGLSPVDEAEKAALSRLAETVLEDTLQEERDVTNERRDPATRPQTNQFEIDTLIARAVDAQMHHRVNEAIEAYRKLMSTGIVRPEIKFNLGLLYFETMRYDEAVELLKETVSDKDYALASHYALGQCYRARGQMDDAVEHFLQVVKIVDLSNVSREQADDLISVYAGLAESYAAKGDRAKAEVFSQSLEEFLTSRGWEDKVTQVRHHLEALRTEDSQTSLAEVIEVPESDKVLEALALCQEYMRRDKLGAASEECLRAIELAPGYLPAHIRLAEVLVRQKRLTEAQAKFQTLAELSAIRGDVKRAESIYRSELKLASDDVVTRSKLIDLMLQQNRHDDALAEYLELGEMYNRQDQPAKALEKFSEGARLAARTSSASPSATTLRHRVAEARVRQGDLRGALTAYQEICQQSPEDERARFYTIDLEFRLGPVDAAVRDLDKLLSRYADLGEPRKALGVLDALVQNYPTQPALVTRLAHLHHALGDVTQAVAILDTLGEAQLSAGNPQAAAATIRQIIALNPPRVEEYHALLAQIGE